MSVMHVYGSDSGAVMLIGEHELRVLGEMVLGNIFWAESNWVRGTALAAFVTKC